jgi:hypothetical protein
MRLVRAALLSLAFAASPVALAAPCGFIDVDDANPAHAPFCDSVEWLKLRNITLGCNLPGTLYCPNDPVSRLHMAAFMYRLGFQNAFLQGGNAFGTAAVLGTTDNQPLNVIVGHERVMRYEPNPISPNVIGGHFANNVTAGVHGATIAGGDANRASGNWSTVAGGNDNTASGVSSSVAGGSFNTASGDYSIVAGGAQNTASGDSAFAAGSRAEADQEGCFVFAYWLGGLGGSCLGTPRIARFLLDHGLSVDYFTRRPDGGGTRWVHIGDLISGQTIATSNGAFLSDGGAWTNASDANAKHAFEELDKRSILDRLAELPIRAWRYRVEADDIRHIGPTAQDFKAAFGLGQGDTGIGTVDADGVALAAIQGLNAKIESVRAAKDAEIAALRAELAAIRSVLATIAEGRPTQTAVVGP